MKILTKFPNFESMGNSISQTLVWSDNRAAAFNSKLYASHELAVFTVSSLIWWTARLKSMKPKLAITGKSFCSQRNAVKLSNFSISEVSKELT